MATTPGRRTEITLNSPVTVPVQGAWWQDLSLQDISTGAQSSNGDGSLFTAPPNGNYRVSFLQNIGWRIQQFQETLNYVHETTDTDTTDFNPAGWANPGGSSGLFQSGSAHRTPTELTGLGSYSSATGPNDPYYWKKVPAGQSVAVANVADQLAYPDGLPVGADTPYISMDRVYTGPTNHMPNQDIWFRFWVPKTTPFRTAQLLVYLYFSGIPTYITSDGIKPGNGQYQLALYSDGTAILAENTVNNLKADKWIIRARMNWCPSQQVVGQQHVVTIRSDAHQDSNGQWQGSAILFIFDNTNATNFFQEVIQLGVNLIAPSLPQTYNPIQITPVQPTLAPLRISVRRDIFMSLRVQKALYHSVGYLNVKVQQSPFEARDPLGEPLKCPLKVTLYGTFLTGATVDVNVYEKTSGTSLLQTLVTPGDGFLGFDFKCPLDDFTTETFFGCVITLRSTSLGAQSPTVNRITFVREPIYKASTPTPVIVPKVLSISMSGPDRDPTHETITFTIGDLLGKLTSILQKQGGQTFRVKDYFDPLNPSKYSVLQQGRLAVAKFLQRGNTSNITGYPKWGIYQCMGTGEWSTLYKLKTQKVYNFAASTDGSGKPYKVTDAIRAILQDNYLPSQYDIPDLSIRFFVEDNSKNVLTIESYTEIGPLIASWARDYLGAFLRWDPNYTNGGGPNDTNGCWRLMVPPSPVGVNTDGLPGYNYVCQFLTTRPSGTKGIPAEHPAAWPTIIGYNPDGSNMVQTFCVRKTTSSEIIPPEGNEVLVTGVGVFNSKGAKGGTLASYQGKHKISQILHNWPAADFGQNGTSDGHPLPDPTNPDYTDGIPLLIYYSDPALRTQQAVDFVARRIFDLSCHSQKYIILEAPLIYISPQKGDTKWIRPRPLAFGDPVLFNGEPMFVWSAPSGAWASGEDENQMAAYELRSVPALTTEFTSNGKDQQYLAICAAIA